jgi:RNase P subunit RPR2
MPDVFRYCTRCGEPLFTEAEIYSRYKSNHVYCRECHEEIIDEAAERLRNLYVLSMRQEESDESSEIDMESTEAELSYSEETLSSGSSDDFFEDKCYWCLDKGEYYTENPTVRQNGFPVFVLACETCALKPKYRPYNWYIFCVCVRAW